MNTPIIKDDTIVIDNSGYTNIEQCKRRAFYYLHEQREPAGLRAPLEFGSILHHILDTRYRMGTDILTVEQDALLTATAREAFSSVELQDDEYRNLSYMLDLVATYLKEYPREPWSVMTLNGVPLIERSFAVPVGTITLDRPYTVVLTGRIDLFTQPYYGDLQPYHIYDHKTASVTGPSYYESLQLATQPWGYMFAATQILGYAPISCTFNVVGTRKPLKSGGVNREFKRHEVRYSLEGIQEWRHDLLNNLASYLTQLKEHGEDIPRSTYNCFGKYGRCPYYDVCFLPAGQRAFMLSSGMYKDVTWNPLDLAKS